MTDKIRGVVAIVIGAFALFQGYQFYTAKPGDWHGWLELGAGIVLIALGIWRFQRKPPVDTLLQ